MCKLNYLKLRPVYDDTNFFGKQDRGSQGLGLVCENKLNFLDIFLNRGVEWDRCRGGWSRSRKKMIKMS